MRQTHEHPPGDLEKLLGVGVAITALIFLLEFFGGLWTHSLALLSDAWHIFIDIWSLLLSFFAVFLARRPASDRRTFGLHRLEVVSALVNGMTVFLIAIAILYAAVQRFSHPREVHTHPMIVVAGMGLALNLAVAALFYRPSRQDLNVHGAFLHVLGDALGTLAVLIAGFLIMATKSPQIDPVISAFIAGVVLWGSIRLLRESFNIFLEGVPRSIHMGSVEEEILRVNGVESVHDLHVWSICSHLSALSGHVLLTPTHMEKQHTILEGINRSLKERFGISHTTIQLESKAWPQVEQATNW